MLSHVDLCSGIGGFALGLGWTGGFKTIQFCEIDPYCREVLAKHWPDVPIQKDLKTFDGSGLGRVDCITAGYPCQGESYAGKRLGEEDDRHLWPAVFDVIKALRPTWFIGENVAGHITLGLEQVLSDLEAESYAQRVFVIPACARDAWHRRDRVWIVGYREREGLEGHAGNETGAPGRQAADGSTGAAGVCRTVGHANRNVQRAVGGIQEGARAEPGGVRGTVADADTDGEQQPRGGVEEERRRPGNSGKARTFPDTDSSNGHGRRGSVQVGRQRGAQKVKGDGHAEGTERFAERGLGRMADGLPRWLDEPRDVPRVITGQPDRVDRLKALGNAVVPQIAQEIGYAILQAEEEMKAA